LFAYNFIIKSFQKEKIKITREISKEYYNKKGGKEKKTHKAFLIGYTFILISKKISQYKKRFSVSKLL
jgi:hypothetical protein